MFVIQWNGVAEWVSMMEQFDIFIAMVG